MDRESAAQGSAQHLGALSVPLVTALISLERVTSSLKVTRIKEVEGQPTLSLPSNWTIATMPSISAE